MPAADASPPLSHAKAAALSGPWWRSWRNLLKLAYAIGAGVFCVWLVSFAPSEGPPLAKFVPKNAALMLQVRSGYALLGHLEKNPALQELLNDPDAGALFKPRQRRDEILANWRKAPRIVQWLVPPTPEGIYPFAGRELAVVMLPPGQPNSAEAQTTAPYSGENSKRAPLLVFTRLSGAPGQLARIAAAYRPASKRARFFDLGGGLIAVGINGAQPEFSAASPRSEKTPDNSPKAANGPAPDARLTLWPRNLQAPPKPPDFDVSSQIEQLQAEGVPDTVLRALLKPPGAAEMLDLDNLPAELTMDFRFVDGGGISATGLLTGAALPPPPGTLPATPPEVFAEGVVPFDAQACFHKYLESNMRLKKNASRMSSGQRRWSGRLADLEDNDVDLERDLWPALGHVICFRIQPSPQNRNYTNYGLISGSVPFNGKLPAARIAAGELARERWDYLFDGPPAGVNPPYVRRFRKGSVERYVLRTSQINVPSWAVDETSVSFHSDVGPFALRDGTLPDDLPAPPALAGSSGGEPRYFLRLDGEKLAPTAEAGATNYFDAIDEEIGPGEFLSQYPDAPLRIRVVKKLTRLLGKFYLEVKPGAAAEATIQFDWKPGKISEPDAGQNEDVVPPPPPAL